MPATVNGTATKKVDRQPRVSTRSPPMSGPETVATAMTEAM
jgi:hypothetical protein